MLAVGLPLLMRAKVELKKCAEPPPHSHPPDNPSNTVSAEQENHSRRYLWLWCLCGMTCPPNSRGRKGKDIDIEIAQSRSSRRSSTNTTTSQIPIPPSTCYGTSASPQPLSMSRTFRCSGRSSAAPSRLEPSRKTPRINTSSTAIRSR